MLMAAIVSNNQSSVPTASFLSDEKWPLSGLKYEVLMSDWDTVILRKGQGLNLDSAAPISHSKQEQSHQAKLI